MFVISILLAFCACTGGAHLGPSQLDGRIVGGNDANIEDLPYQLSLQFEDMHVCGASIISVNWALTAAHCIFGVTVSDYSLRAGSSIRESGGSLHYIKRIIPHPSFSEQTAEYDYALIEVDSPFDITKPGIKVISLTEIEPTVGDIATISGWGALGAGLDSPKQLQVVQLPIISRDDCKVVYGDQITDRNICAGLKAGGKDSCQRDSGGPLVVNGLLAGVVSWGIGCAAPNSPGIYANVANQLAWIRNTANL